ncbi:ArnT family glycosyltransferase [Nocardia blacklockiae]|uniref:ArnT family glycosyltransferase n=1 Tax=Nocardia blacklockiae TaxID=480036 RepID=UPI001895BB5A|nr:glycosyltransferase family 39 protein [Nocardia blacklockiae]MBF6169951.1 glycosyltransferase family 39 protein [Nocardia blacklockiae]
MTTTEAPADRAEPTAPREAPQWRSRGRRLLFGPPEQPRWARPALWALLVATLVFYLWGLSALGWANEYYAAAVQAGTQDWKALLFGSLDAGNAITVDKPPASLWVMGLSGRLLGFGTFSMLLPQALMAVGSVALLYAAVRRWSGPEAGLLAGGILALTPVAVTMFRDNNPDALLVFLMVVAAYCVVRATENGSGRWLAPAGVAIGFGFLTKLLQAFLVLPAFALAFLVAAPIGLWPRIWKLLGAAAAVVVSCGWYLVLGTVWPADSRPYIGGSTDNSLLQLALGYNGLGRVFGGNGNGGPGGGPRGGGPSGGPGGGPGAMFGGDTGLTRLFRDAMGTEISWLLPAALLGLVALLWFTRATPRTGRTRAALLLWGGWVLVTGLVFSFMKGIIHPYYTVALAPALAALVALTVVELWRARTDFTARAVLGAMSAVTGVWGFVLLGRTPEWFPVLRWVVLIGCLLVAAVLVVGAHRLGKLTAAVAAAGLVTGLAGPAAFALDNVAVADSHTGGMPTSGPKTDRGGWGGPRPAGQGGGPGDGGTNTPGAPGVPGVPGGTNGPGGFGPGGFGPDAPRIPGAPDGPGGSNGTQPPGSGGMGAPGAPGFEGQGGQGVPGSGRGSGGSEGPGEMGAPGETPSGARGDGGDAARRNGPGSSADNAALRELLEHTDNRWAAAAIGSHEVSSLELATGKSLMAIGGFTGGDAYPTLDRFQKYVADGEIHYFLGGNDDRGGFGRSGTSSEITAWVKAHFTATEVGGTTVYDLTKPVS